MSIEKKLKKSPINYFSDLFIIVMVVSWIIEIIIMNLMAIYATIVLNDIYLWSEVQTLVTVPLSSGGAIWMIKNGVQHAIAANRGKKCNADFAMVEDTEINIEDEVQEL